MKKSFQKTLIAASVGAVMLAAAGTASANSLLFPYFTTASGAQSMVSLSTNSVNGATNLNAGTARTPIHYVWNYGPSCIHADASGSMSANDVSQHSVLNPTVGGAGKANTTDASGVAYLNVPNTYGFMTVSTTAGTTPAGAAFAPGTADITGDMAIVDPATGLVVSYAGITNAVATEGDFSGITDKNFNLSFYGNALVDTSWYGLVTGNMNARIVAGANWDASATLSNNGNVFSNDEVPRSGTVTKRIDCSATFTVNDLMSADQQGAIGASGGLIHSTASINTTLAGTTTTITVGTGLVLNKMQTVKAAVGAPFAGKMFLHREQGNAF